MVVFEKMEDERVVMYRAMIKQRDARQAYLTDLATRTTNQQMELDELISVKAREMENVKTFWEAVKKHNIHLK